MLNVEHVHISCMVCIREGTKFSVKLDGANHLGDLSVGTEDNIKIDLKETKCVYELEL
jgi:hypothetical protein